MDAMNSTMRIEDLSAANVTEEAMAGVDLFLLLGTWINTNRNASGIPKVVIELKEGTVWVRVFGAGESEAHDWGEVQAGVYTDGVGLHQATSFTTFYDFGFMDVRLQTYLAKGVLVIVSYTQFKDDSGRTNYFGKEFFYRQ
jgi:hypothetical protein